MHVSGIRTRSSYQVRVRVIADQVLRRHKRRRGNGLNSTRLGQHAQYSYSYSSCDYVGLSLNHLLRFATHTFISCAAPSMPDALGTLNPAADAIRGWHALRCRILFSHRCHAPWCTHGWYALWCRILWSTGAMAPWCRMRGRERCRILWHGMELLDMTSHRTTRHCTAGFQPTAPRQDEYTCVAPAKVCNYGQGVDVHGHHVVWMCIH